MNYLYLEPQQKRYGNKKTYIEELIICNCESKIDIAAYRKVYPNMFFKGKNTYLLPIFQLGFIYLHPI